MSGELSQGELDALLAQSKGPETSATPATPNSAPAAATSAKTPTATTIVEDPLKKIEELTATAADKARPEIGAATLARMAGLATGSELKVLEGKLDLLAGRVANMTVRVERALTMLGNLPSGNDFERLDVNISSVKTMLREVLDKSGGGSKDTPDEKVTKGKLDAFLKRHSGSGKEGDGNGGGTAGGTEGGSTPAAS